MFWKRCCAGSAPASRRSRRRSILSTAPMNGITTTTAIAMARKRRTISHRHPARSARACRACAERAVAVGAPQDAAALYRLMAWLSPAYPIGAFSYSSGIEWAVAAGNVTDAATLERWLAVMIGEGGGFCDAVFLACAHRAVDDADDVVLRGVAELAAAFAPSKERHLETTAQGR